MILAAHHVLYFVWTGNFIQSLFGVEDDSDEDDGPRVGPSNVSAKMSNVELD